MVMVSGQRSCVLIALLAFVSTGRSVGLNLWSHPKLGRRQGQVLPLTPSLATEMGPAAAGGRPLKGGGRAPDLPI